MKNKDNPFEFRSGDAYYDGAVERSYFRYNSEYDNRTRRFGNACKDES